MSTVAPVQSPTQPRPTGYPLHEILKPLASLRLTVALFAISIVLILVGTLAQVDQTMWEVLDNYFRCWVAMVPVQVFFPASFFSPPPQFPEWMKFPFPGGWTVGTLLAINLVAAHATRFRVSAKGSALRLGLILTLLGWGLAIFFVIAGQGDRIQDEPIIPYDLMWQILRWTVAVCWGISVMVALKAHSKLDFWIKSGVSLTLGGLAFFLVVSGGHFQLSDASLRIIWQLSQGLIAGVALLIGSNYLFGQRGGIVVIHSGVALLMFGELLVSLTAVEESMFIREGEVAHFARQTNEVELAFIDRAAAEVDQVTVLDLMRLREGGVFRDDALPCDIELVRFIKNARLREVAESDENPATAGAGLRWVVEEVPGGSGASGGEVDMSAAYVRFIPKAEQGTIQTYLLAQQLNDATLFMGVDQDFNEQIDFGDRLYDVALRFRRNYKPYSIKLNDIRKDDYLGTDTPRDYSSYIVLNDPVKGVTDRRVRIWMNNPLRYSGETFYQTNYSKTQDGTEITTLAVVTNVGWMLPYIACMFGLVGMLAHFSKTLTRFIDRISRAGRETPRNMSVGSVSAAVCVCLALVSISAWSRGPRAGEMDLVAAGKIPVVSEGRAKPLDTLARNTLKVISLKEAVRYTDAAGATHEVSAVKWMLDVATDPKQAAEAYPVFRIENLDVLELLGLQPRKRFRYALAEFEEKLDELVAEAEKAREVQRQDPSSLTLYHRKVMEVITRWRTYERLRDSFMPIPYPPRFTKAEREADPAGAEARDREIARLAIETPRINSLLMSMRPPLTVPIATDDDSQLWLPYAVARNESFVRTLFQGGQEVPAIEGWTAILDAYHNDNAERFNRAVADYGLLLEREGPADLSLAAIGAESSYNRFAPFRTATILYLLAFVANATGWLVWFQPLRRFSFWLLLFTFGLHTLALIVRMYISGRPPVTDLHSSAIFIGWGGVVFCLIVEAIHRFSLGNAVAAACGFATLLISDGLALEGDTFTVMQAVLDTQFWLATHVVCITLGYTTTFVAGLLGAIYIGTMLVSTVFADRDLSETRLTLTRCTYGTLCFALLFSFVGTVLGGLWADDSWGRFWGWDPKENGALIIVLWNALILHARWGGMIKERGLACLAVLGNVTTAWSWFGVNELQVGLHSYGFTEGALVRLALFCGSMFLIAGLGLLLGAAEDKLGQSRQS